MQPIKHTSRNFTSALGTIYVLPSDEIERQRLALQQGLLKRLYGGKLLLAPYTPQPYDRILDCGAGSGVWLLDLANEVSPLTKLTGIDVEPILFPTSHPDNIQFLTASIISLPREWSNTFNLVHQRLLMGALTRIQWPKALKELHRVLIPGGWVQLCEMGPRTAGPATKRHKAAVEALYTKLGLLTYCAYHMPRFLTDAGFVNVHVEERAIPLGKWGGRDGIDGRDDLIGIWRGQKTPILDAGGLGYVQSEEEFDHNIENIEKEWDGTPGANGRIFIFYAQKVQV